MNSGAGYIDSKSYQEFVKYICDIVSEYKKGSENKYVEIEKDIHTLLEKINDEDLYLGVVGSFSSGKSTFINSMIHKNLLPTDAVQGTTVAASILKKSNKNDLEITYNNGDSVKLSDNPQVLLSKYQIEYTDTFVSEESTNFFKKIVAWIKRILGIKEKNTEKIINLDIEMCISLFRKIVATEELATDIKYVTLYYENENIPYDIALVDTPGTESLNDKHNNITINTINDLCDAIVIIIPYDEPVSEELITYIKDNLNENKSECIFVVTKIELLGDLDELPRLMRVIKKRLENGVSIEDAQVIPMPTLIYLKSVDTEMTTTFLDNINDTDKEQLIDMYKVGIEKINNLLKNNRNRYISKKLISISERITKKLNDNLSEVIDNCNDKEYELQDELVEPVEDFVEISREKINKLFEQQKIQMEGKLSVISIQFLHLKLDMEERISECKEDSQLIEVLNFGCRDTLSEIQTVIGKNLRESLNVSNAQLRKLEDEFYNLYSKCGVKKNCALIPNSSSGFFGSEFIYECENIINHEMKLIQESIKDDSSGFFNKVKAIFTDPVDKHKEMAFNKVSEIVMSLSEKTNKYTVDRIDFKIAFNKGNALRNFSKMINSNFNRINEHNQNTICAIEVNSKNKLQTQQDIQKINQYIAILKEEEKDGE